MALCKFFRPVATPQPKRKRLRLMYQHDEEMECLLITSPSSSASLSGSQGSPDLMEAEKSAAVHEDDLVMKAVMRSISLTDPFTLQLIESPVRGRDCEHVEAFDKRSFLDFNDLMEQNRWCRLTKRWKCPFCDRHIRSKDLVTAADVQEVLDEAKLTHSDATFAVLHPDGRLSLPSSKSLQPAAEPAAVDSDEETCPQHQEHEEPRAQVAQPAEKRSCAPETAGNARSSEGDVRSRTSKRGLERASNTPRGKASKKEKKIKKAALAAAKAAWERQNEKQGSILSYCSNAKTGDLAQTLV